MERLRRAMVWLGLALGVAVLLLFALPSYRQGEASIAGKTANDFAFTLDGKSARLSDLRGKVVVLNFWATWCPPCVGEMPSLVRLQQRMQNKGIQVLAVSIAADGSAYHKFLNNYKVDLLTVRDPGHKSADLYGSFKWPETYIIDRK